jgi:hypothetical protein
VRFAGMCVLRGEQRKREQPNHGVWGSWRWMFVKTVKPKTAQSLPIDLTVGAIA